MPLGHRSRISEPEHGAAGPGCAAGVARSGADLLWSALTCRPACRSRLATMQLNPPPISDRSQASSQRSLCHSRVGQRLIPLTSSIWRAELFGVTARSQASSATDPEPLSGLAARMRRPGGVAVWDRYYHLRLYKECFVGARLIPCRQANWDAAPRQHLRLATAADLDANTGCCCGTGDCCLSLG